jgi:hypothetical protein
MRVAVTWLGWQGEAGSMFYTSRFSRYAQSVVFLVVCLLSFSSCGSDAVYGDEAVLTGGVYLDCSRECRDHGSCGASEETGKTIILLGASPAFAGVSAVDFQGLTDGSAVEVVDTKVVAGIEQRSRKDVQIRFYEVVGGSDDAGGWVPGFCIANQAP